MKETYKYAWQFKYIKYLGVNSAGESDKLDCNFGPLLKAFEGLI